MRNSLALSLLTVLSFAACADEAAPPAPPVDGPVGDPVLVDRCLAMADDIQGLCDACPALAGHYAGGDCASEMAINAACASTTTVNEAELDACYDWINAPVCSQNWSNPVIVNCFEAWR